MRAKFGQCEDSDRTWGWNFLPLHRFDGEEGRHGNGQHPPTPEPKAGRNLHHATARENGCC